MENEIIHKAVILFGSEGALGSQLKEKYVADENYRKIILIDRKIKNEILEDYEEINRIKIKNLFDRTEIENIKGKILRCFGYPEKKLNIDLLVISTIGGYYGGKKFFEIDIESWQEIFEKNFFANLAIAKIISEFRSYFLETGVAFISSYLTKNYEPNKSVYIISKNALNNLINLSALEMESENISFFGIAPYILDTKENRDWIKDAKKLINVSQIYEILEIFNNNKNKFAGEIIYLK